MEEILASIRRIISDDEANSEQQRATSSEYAEQVRADDVDDGAADTQIIADIERALGGARASAAEPQPAPSADDDDLDILDLTEAGPASNEDVMMADEPIAVLEEVVFQTEVYEETQPKIDFGAAFPPSEPLPFETAESFAEVAESMAIPDDDYIVPEPPQSLVDEPAIVAEMPVSEPPAAVQAQAAPSLDEFTSPLERAIAALKAGDLAAFAREAQAGTEAPDPVYVPPAPIYPGPEPEAAPSPEWSAEPEVPSDEPQPAIAAIEEETIVIFEPEPEPEPAIEPSAPSWAAEAPSWSDEGAEPESEPEAELELEPETLPWHGEGLAWRGAPPANEFELDPGRVNGGSDHEQHDYAVPGSSKSLEDSVKEMLRPMLKQWLDENMPRVLTAALREELESSEHQRRG
jgi:cell pole-organizing protein PopZ